MPLACACWHTCHMVLGLRLGKDDAPRTGWDTKPPAASPTSRTERPHLVPFPSQRHGEQAGTQLRQIQTHRCTQRRPQSGTDTGAHTDSGTHSPPPPSLLPPPPRKRQRSHHMRELGRSLWPLVSLSVVLKQKHITTSLQKDETEKLGKKKLGMCDG